MNIVIEGIDSLSRNDVRNIRSLKEFAFISDVDIREENMWKHSFPGADALAIYNVNITVEPSRSISVFVYPDEIHIIDYDTRLTACVYLNRLDYARLEII